MSAAPCMSCCVLRDQPAPARCKHPASHYAPRAPHPETGHWVALVAGSPPSRNQTGLGAAVYTPDGQLASFAWSGVRPAILRGDLPSSMSDFTELELEVPQTFEEMEKRLGSDGNAMSVIRWEAPALVTLDASSEAAARLFEVVARRADDDLPGT